MGAGGTFTAAAERSYSYFRARSVGGGGLGALGELHLGEEGREEGGGEEEGEEEGNGAPGWHGVRGMKRTHAEGLHTNTPTHTQTQTPRG